MKKVISLIYLCLIVTGLAHAQRVYVVGSVADLEDNVPGDGLCEAGYVPRCTLRAAIKEANLSPNLAAGPDEIHFSGLVDSSLITITLGHLPAITDPIIIDGFTGPTNRISLNINDPARDGLILSTGSDQSEIRGMIIGNGDVAIRVHSGNNLITDNFLGTGPNGWDVGNYMGVLIESTGNTVSHNVIGFNHTGIQNLGTHTTLMSNFIGVSRDMQNRANSFGTFSFGDDAQIGGPLPENGNLFGYNTVHQLNVGQSNILVQHNFVGTNAAGNNLGSSSSGIFIEGTEVVVVDNTVGFVNDGIIVVNENVQVQRNYVGVTVDGHNVGNSGFGIDLSWTANSVVGGPVSEANFIGFNGRGIGVGSADFTILQGNFIGTNAAGDNWGNTQSGIDIGIGSANNVIGYDVSDVITGDLLYANTIAYNGGNGIVQSEHDDQFLMPVRNVFRGNVIYNNGGMGIDLGDDGPSPNDVDDGDDGSNDFQNYPDVTQAGYNGGRDIIAVEYTISSDDAIVNYPLTVDVYLADDDVSGEGKTYIGSDTYAMPNQQGRVEIPVAGLTWQSDDVVVLTATDADGNTSEFSPVSQQLGGGSSGIVFNRDQLQPVRPQQQLSAPYPNPFNPTTSFALTLPEVTHTRITVHDLLGRQVALLQNGELSGGLTHTFNFDAAHLASGTYLLRVETGAYHETRRLLLLK